VERQLGERGGQRARADLETLDRRDREQPREPVDVAVVDADAVDPAAAHRDVVVVVARCLGEPGLRVVAVKLCESPELRRASHELVAGDLRKHQILGGRDTDTRELGAERHRLAALAADRVGVDQARVEVVGLGDDPLEQRGVRRCHAPTVTQEW
jgi:hypothetical protein